MAILTSPGVDIQVIDESIGGTAGPGTIPLIIIATKENKRLTNSVGPVSNIIAPGTLKENSNTLYLITSQNELLETFGEPIFYKNQGTPIQGYELNEYGLLAAYSFLGISNRAYVIRADVDLSQLEPSNFEPTNPALTGTYWLDLNETSWGLFRSNGGPVPGTAWESKQPIVINNNNDIESIIISDIGLSANNTQIGISGNLEINDTIIAVSAVDTLVSLAATINSASIENIKANVIRYQSKSWLVIRNTKAENIDISGTPALVNGLGLNDPVTTIQPKMELGNPGNVAVLPVLKDNLVFEKIKPTDKFGETDPDAVSFWFLLGSSRWKMATPTVEVGATIAQYSANPILVPGDGLTISDGNVSFTVNFNVSAIATLSAVYNEILNEIVSGGYSDIFAVKINSNSNLIITNILGEDLFFAEASGNSNFGVLNSLQLQSKFGNKLTYSPHFQIPTNSVDGDYWIKTTPPNNGANFVIKRYSRISSLWSTISTPLYLNDDKALFNLGLNMPVGSIYARYNLYGTSLEPIASHTFRRYLGKNEISVIGTEIPGNSTPSLVPGDQFVIIAGQPNGIQLSTVITLTGTTAEDAAADINNSGLLNVTAVVESGFLKIINNSFFSLSVSYYDPSTDTYVNSGNTGDPLASLGIIENVYISNWEDLDYVASISEPRTEAEEGRLWYNENFLVDIMVNDGDQWRGYRNYYPNTDPNGVQIAGSPPETQSDGTQLVDNDLWLDSTDLENYPKLYRWSSSLNEWVLIDNTDQTTPFGIVFGDARQTSDGKKNGLATQEAFAISDYVDPDAPNPQVYPVGILLFNTRASTYNVKKWMPNYFEEYVGKEESPGIQYSVGNSVFPTNTITKENKGRWVTESGNKLDGSPYMGRKAQRIVIVRSLASTINSNQDIRSEITFFNLIAAPGYPELIDEMINLNTDQKEVAFIVGDTPARLKPTGTDISNWAKNVKNVASTSDEGLAASNPYLGLYYPWLLTTDLQGFEVAVPPSHAILRTIAYNDSVAYPWFAPAGFTRGLITNATSTGYINEENEFEPVILNQGQRDVLYINKINPIAFIPNRGLVAFGQKTLNINENSALSRINVARLVNFLKYNFDILAKPFLFELNDKQTRDQVTSIFERFLGNLVSLRAIYDFAVLCSEANNTPERIDRNELWIDIAIQPAKAIEFIYIPIRIRNTGEDLTNFLPLI